MFFGEPQRAREFAGGAMKWHRHLADDVEIIMGRDAHAT
jgi:hypothetical protein